MRSPGGFGVTRRLGCENSWSFYRMVRGWLDRLAHETWCRMRLEPHSSGARYRLSVALAWPTLRIAASAARASVVTVVFMEGAPLVHPLNLLSDEPSSQRDSGASKAQAHFRRNAILRAPFRADTVWNGCVVAPEAIRESGPVKVEPQPSPRPEEPRAFF